MKPLKNVCNMVKECVIKSVGRSGFKGRVCKMLNRSETPSWDIQNLHRIWIFQTTPSPTGCVGYV